MATEDLECLSGRGFVHAKLTQKMRDRHAAKQARQEHPGGDSMTTLAKDAGNANFM
jgi:hypothetical protein